MRIRLVSILLAGTIILLPSQGCHLHTSGGKQILTDEQMIRILSDMHIAEAASKSLPESFRDSLLDQIFIEVYMSNNTTKEDFEATLRYLSFQPEDLSAIYDSVQSSLKQRQKNPKQ